MSFLPVFREEFEGQPDFIMLTVDAYVDHPSFGHAIISRLIESLGFSICIIPQPQSDADYMRFGEPKYAFLVSGGVVDSMVNNYTVALKRREKDEYSEGGLVGKRPDRAVSVYSRRIKELYPESFVIIGGIEASLRRFAHYDYWSNKVEPSILISSQADLLMYGMGEKTWKELLGFLRKGVPIHKLKDLRGTCYLSKKDHFSKKLEKQILDGDAKYCPSYEEVREDKKSYCKAFNLQSENIDPFTSKLLVQKQNEFFLIQNPPQFPLSTWELDSIYELPYERKYHYSYKLGIPALKEVKFSLTSVRGCFGACNYCAITYHQSRHIQSRSKDSLIREAEKLVKDNEFKGYIHDVGGPTANITIPACKKQEEKGACSNKSCIGFENCSNLTVDESDYLDILRALRELEGVKKVFVRSGVRFDYAMMDKDKSFLKELLAYHVSGQLKVAPEHNSNRVLKLMNKPPFEVFEAFKREFERINRELQKKQYLIPYLISSHPGCTVQDAIRLAEYLKSINYVPDQVQDFYPTPSTKSTCMYYTELNPDTLEHVYVPKTKKEKQIQRALLQFNRAENYEIVKQALLENKRADLIGYSANCLIPPYPPKRDKKGKK